MAGTNPDTLVAALQQLPQGGDRGFRFVGSDREERYFAYADMRREAERRAAFLQAHGLRKGDRVALVIPEGYEFVLTFLGATVAGLVPVPIFPRASFKAVEGYLDTLAHIVRASGAEVMIAMERNRPVVEQVLERDTPLRTLTTLETLLQGETPDFHAPAVRPEDLCFLQFTSGSTSLPKGVMVTHANLVANATAFLGPEGLDRRDDDVGVSWLPLFHDMGLIGFILGTLICDIPVVILPTETFARGPRVWLETIHKHRGTITYAPNFAYNLAAKRLKDRDIESLDLSCLRVAGCGAEPINPKTLRDFATRLAPAGFRPEALLPSYGMAEATLAITFHPQGTPVVVDEVDAEAMKQGRAEPAARHQPPHLSSRTPTQPPHGAVGRDESRSASQELISCGRPFSGHDLRIVDEQGHELPERRVGEIVTRGPSVSPGYYDNPQATEEGFRDGWLHTGDLGYIAEGNLYICGRLKDLIIIRGANFYPQDIEWTVGEVPGVRRDNAVAFSVMQGGEETLIIAAEGTSRDAPSLREAIASKVAQTIGLRVGHVAVVRVGSLPKTSSGKVQRRKTKRLYEEGRLEEHPVEQLAARSIA